MIKCFVIADNINVIKLVVEFDSIRALTINLK